VYLSILEMLSKQMEDEIIDQETILHGSGNVFTDLGFEDADEMLAKAKLVHAIAGAMEASGITQTQMASMIGIDRQKFLSFSEELPTVFPPTDCCAYSTG